MSLRGGMSLRARVAVLVAAVVTAVAAAVGVAAVRSAKAELIEEVDNDLKLRAQLLGLSNPLDETLFRSMSGKGGAFEDGAFEIPGDTLVERLRRDPFGFLVSFDVNAQVVVTWEDTPDKTRDKDQLHAGEVVLALDEDSAVVPEHNTIHRARSGPVIESVTGIGGSPLRLMTQEIFDGVYVQISRPLDEVERAVDDLAVLVLLYGLLAVGAAAAGAWFLAGRAVRPIVRLAETAERIAATGDIERPIEGSGSGEVGRLSRSFRTMLAALATSRRQQHRLVADAGHELRTPLTSLRTNVDVLRRAPDLSEEDRAAVLDDLDAELVELSGLAAELVELASEVHIDEETDLVELSEVAGAVAEQARRRTGREIEVRVDRGGAVEGRPEALARAVRNLVDNAVKFSEAGAVEVVVDGGAVTVHDAGPGIPEGDRRRVFERFRRLESNLDRPGSGLGLAIVSQVAEAHGGTVSAGASPLGGAAVGFRIPEIDG